MSAPKPLLIFDGNCQAQQLAAIVKSTGIADTIHVGGDWGFVPAYRGMMVELVPAEREAEVLAEARARGAKLIQVSQVSPRRRHKFSHPLEGIDKRLLFPELRFWAMSPQKFHASFKAEADPERIFQLDLDSARASQEKSQFPVDMAAYVEREAHRRPLFHAVNHCGGAILARLIDGLAELFQTDLDIAALRSAAAELDRSEGLNYETDHPVTAEVRSRLGFDWGPSYDAYEEMLVATRLRNWDALQRNKDRYQALFGGDSQYWKTVATLGAARKDDSVALPAFALLLERYPGLTGPWLHLASYLKGTGREDEVRALIATAESSLQGLSLFHSVASRLYFLLGDLANAEAHARIYLQRSPGNANATTPLLQVLLRQNRSEEARTILATVKDLPWVDRQQVRKTAERFAGGRELADEMGL